MPWLYGIKCKHFQFHCISYYFFFYYIFFKWNTVHDFFSFLSKRQNAQRKRTGRKKGWGETCSSYPQAVLRHKKTIKKQTERDDPKSAWEKKIRYSMLFNIWTTRWLSAQILPHGCWAWVRNSVAVRLTVRSLSRASTLFIRLSVFLFIWLSNYPSQQTPHHELNVNTIVNLGHMSHLVWPLPEYWSQTTFKASMLVVVTVRQFFLCVQMLVEFVILFVIRWLNLNFPTEVRYRHINYRLQVNLA